MGILTWLLNALTMASVRYLRLSMSQVDIYKAVNDGNQKLVEYLLSIDPSRIGTLKEGIGLLHCAVSRNNMQMMQALVRCKADVNCVTERGTTPLHYAAANGFEEAATFLVDHGALVNARNAYGNTPLHEAVYRNDLAMIMFLLKREADVNERNTHSRTPLQEALKQASPPEILETLLERVHSMTDTLCAACEFGSRDMVRMLINRGIDVNAKLPSTVLSALHVAARSDQAEIVNMLVAAGADPDSQNRINKTPLHIAAASNSMKTVQALIDAGADVNARDKTMRTPLDEVSKENSHIEKLLRAHGGISSMDKRP